MPARNPSDTNEFAVHPFGAATGLKELRSTSLPFGAAANGARGYEVDVAIGSATFSPSAAEVGELHNGSGEPLVRSRRLVHTGPGAPPP